MSFPMKPAVRDEDRDRCYESPYQSENSIVESQTAPIDGFADEGSDDTSDRAHGDREQESG